MITDSEANPNGKEGDIVTSISDVQKWINSLDGKTEKVLVNTFKNLKPIRSTWDLNGEKELKLTYRYQYTTISFFFLNKEVIKVSQHYLSN